jgi:hypothetical protein
MIRKSRIKPEETLAGSMIVAASDRSLSKSDAPKIERALLEGFQLPVAASGSLITPGAMLILPSVGSPDSFGSASPMPALLGLAGLKGGVFCEGFNHAVGVKPSNGKKDLKGCAAGAFPLRGTEANCTVMLGNERPGHPEPQA